MCYKIIAQPLNIPKNFLFTSTIAHYKQRMSDYFNGFSAHQPFQAKGTVVVIGGGPAGCSVAIKLKQESPDANIIMIYPEKDYLKDGLPACHQCFGMISAEVVSKLNELGITIPPKMILNVVRQANLINLHTADPFLLQIWRKIDSALRQSRYGLIREIASGILPVLPAEKPGFRNITLPFEKAGLANAYLVAMGNGPSGLHQQHPEIPEINFQRFFQQHAETMGIRMVHGQVHEIDLFQNIETRPQLKYTTTNDHNHSLSIEADMVINASGVRSGQQIKTWLHGSGTKKLFGKPLKTTQMGNREYILPPVHPTYKNLDGKVTMFTGIRGANTIMAGLKVINGAEGPLGTFLSFSMLPAKQPLTQDEMKQIVKNAFSYLFAHPIIQCGQLIARAQRDQFPPRLSTTNPKPMIPIYEIHGDQSRANCACFSEFPNEITIQNLYHHRFVSIGDSAGGGKLNRSGIYYAIVHGMRVAEIVAKHGIGKADFEKYFEPTMRWFKIDNRFMGKYLIHFHGWVSGSPFANIYYAFIYRSAILQHLILRITFGVDRQDGYLLSLLNFLRQSKIGLRVLLDFANQSHILSESFSNPNFCTTVNNCFSQLESAGFTVHIYNLSFLSSLPHATANQLRIKLGDHHFLIIESPTIIPKVQWLQTKIEEKLDGLFRLHAIHAQSLIKDGLFNLMSDISRIDSVESHAEVEEKIANTFLDHLLAILDSAPSVSATDTLVFPDCREVKHRGLMLINTGHYIYRIADKGINSKKMKSDPEIATQDKAYVLNIFNGGVLTIDDNRFMSIIRDHDTNEVICIRVYREHPAFKAQYDDDVRNKKFYINHYSTFLRIRHDKKYMIAMFVGPDLINGDMYLQTMADHIPQMEAILRKMEDSIDVIQSRQNMMNRIAQEQALYRSRQTQNLDENSVYKEMLTRLESCDAIMDPKLLKKWRRKLAYFTMVSTQHTLLHPERIDQALQLAIHGLRNISFLQADILKHHIGILNRALGDKKAHDVNLNIRIDAKRSRKMMVITDIDQFETRFLQLIQTSLSYHDPEQKTHSINVEVSYAPDRNCIQITFQDNGLDFENHTPLGYWRHSDPTRAQKTEDIFLRSLFSFVASHYGVLGDDEDSDLYQLEPYQGNGNKISFKLPALREL